ncbi:UvrD-helicase domain-containing protein [Mumia sp. zg.B17]|uniref:UvrD-helicase domain-containing protein n=1 Tax=Mumia sp. zg.B17 TaxID=2855446 RepID=UPI001C6E84F0|nr:UvrD-helicase domain-containing protein [Mumia sp. zg.B17]MBW9205324.1 UvrD-helicase domain-containing protein [Mumia sp. zg.B17]
MTSLTTLNDKPARDRITTETDRNLFVDAGAGSGKTRALVDRVTFLVLDAEAPVPLRHIVAVTFTEKAGAELRDRLRVAFEGARRSSVMPERQARASEALEDLDSAAIGTLHAFAQRILTRHPIEAGLPPLIEVLDEVASSVAFEERWTVMQRELLDDDAMGTALLLALAADVRLAHLRSLTRAFNADWDLIADRVPQRAPAIVLPDLSALWEAASRLAARADECTDESDKFLPRLAAFGAWGDELRTAVDDRARYTTLLRADTLKTSYGRGANWPDLAGLKAACKELQARAASVAHEVTEATLRPLASWIAHRVRADAERRAAEGRVEFHDLLVLARDVLRRDADVRAALQTQFRRILLDEFQDTDPIQIELAVRIAGGRDADAEDWHDVVVPPGSLFVVGDPKQSIYRFRRASIALYLDARDWFGADDRVTLTTNFRTVAPVLGWVNDVFATVIEASPRSQPEYAPLDPARSEHPSVGPAVTVLGRVEHTESIRADALRAVEAADVAATIRRALDEGWTVRDERTGGWRPVVLADVAILIPSRLSLEALETALDREGLPYRAESSSLVYQAAEVRDLLTAAQTIADPSDQFASVQSLRSPLFGCGDDDLWSWKHAGGSFHVLAPTTKTLERLERPNHPVAAGLDALRDLVRRARWMTPSEVLTTIVAERVMLETAAVGPRARDGWRRLRFVVDQARAWSEVEHGGLRAYLEWARRQADDAARVAEAVLPETDVDAIRIMTIHGAKGLEFPVVVLSGMSTRSQRRKGVQLLWTDDGYEVRLVGQVQTNDFEEAAPVDEQMDALERRRLLYVGATRARDHLVVSLHRVADKTDTNACILADAGAGENAWATDASGLDGDSAPAEGARGRRRDLSPMPPPDLAAWQALLDDARAATRLTAVQSASGLEGTDPEIVLLDTPPADAGRAKGGRDVELPPWRKGRYGSAVGRAVHGVLQAVDLATGAGLDDAVAAQCRAEAVTDFSAEVRALAASALKAPVVRRAAEREHWRESYVGTVSEDGTMIEGFVDLIYRDDDGTLHVVDYKTDDVPQAALGARTAFYRPQVAAYEECLRAATGASVTTSLLFLGVGREAWEVPVGR